MREERTGPNKPFNFIWSCILLSILTDDDCKAVVDEEKKQDFHYEGSVSL